MGGQLREVLVGAAAARAAAKVGTAAAEAGSMTAAKALALKAAFIGGPAAVAAVSPYDENRTRIEALADTLAGWIREQGPLERWGVRSPETGR